MRFWLLSLSLLLTNCVAEQRSRVLDAENGEPFVSVWKVKAGKAIWLPLPEGYNYDFVVDWGDGSQSEITSADDPHRTHAYAATGSYTLRISGLVEAWGYHSDSRGYTYGYSYAITSVPELGDVGWKSLKSAFFNCINLTELRGGDVSQVTDLSKVFFYAGSVTPDVSEWDTTKVTAMNSIFHRAYQANPDVSKWNTANVTDMGAMFRWADKANPDVSKWNTTNVTDMSAMFDEAELANPDVSKWDTANVTNMSSMFEEAYAADPDVSKWNTTNVTDMSAMFNGAELANPDVSKWDTANVTNMSSMFEEAYAADPDVSKWNTTNVTDMSAMFDEAELANPNVSKWDTANVTDMQGMFAGATSANPDVSRWNTANVTDMSMMFDGAQVAVPDLSRWDFAKVTCYDNLFRSITLPTTTYSNVLMRIAATSDKTGDELCGETICIEWEEIHPETTGPGWDDPPCLKYEEQFYPLTAGKSKYNESAAAARQKLIDRGWTIEDGGQG